MRKLLFIYLFALIALWTQSLSVSAAPTSLAHGAQSLWETSWESGSNAELFGRTSALDSSPWRVVKLGPFTWGSEQLALDALLLGQVGEFTFQSKRLRQIRNYFHSGLAPPQNLFF